MFTALLLFFFDVVTTLIGGALVFRLWIQYRGIQPSTEVLYALRYLTNFWVGGCQKVLPQRWQIPRYNSLWGAFVFAFLVASLQVYITTERFSVFASMAMAVLLIVKWWLWIMTFALIIQAVSSWVASYSARVQWVHYMVMPLTRPLRYLLGRFSYIGPLDITSLLAFILLSLFSSILNYAITVVMFTLV